MRYRNIGAALASLFLVTVFLVANRISAEEARSLTIEEAKFQMVQLYTEAKLPPMKLKRKYPKLLKADKRASTSRKAYSAAIRKHPKLKAQFDKNDQLDVSFPEKLKLQKPLFAIAATLPSLSRSRPSTIRPVLPPYREKTSALRKKVWMKR